MSPSSPSAFKYEPLPAGDFIRLLHLYPDEPGAPLIARLETVPHDKAPSYEALSYLWGSDVLDSYLEIVTDGPEGRINLGAVPITKSLFHALSDLRQSPETGERPRTIWADAVCINQEDAEEKNTQVVRMGLIYKESGAVVAHVCSDPDGLIASHFRLSQDEIAQKNDVDSSWAATNFAEPAKWLWRTWVIQEAVLAKNLVFLVGRHEIKETDYWEKMIMTLDFSDGHSPIAAIVAMHQVAEDVRKMDKNKDDMFTIRLNPDGNFSMIKKQNPQLPDTVTKPPLTHLLLAARGTHCQDPRDKVFALLGMNIEANELGIAADYKRGVVDVYTDVAHRLLAISGGIHLLCHAYRRHHTELPSYVPDWSVAETLYPSNQAFRALLTQGPTVGLRQHNRGILLRCLSYGSLAQVRAFPNIPADTPKGEKLGLNTLFVFDFLQRCLLDGRLPEAFKPLIFRTVGRTLVSHAFEKDTDAAWSNYIRWASAAMGGSQPERDEQTDGPDLSLRYLSALCTRSSLPWASKMWISDSGFIGNGCEQAEVGDRIVIPFGGTVPLLIRSVSRKPRQEQLRGRMEIALRAEHTQLIPARRKLPPDEEQPENEPFIFVGPCYDEAPLPELEPLQNLQQQRLEVQDQRKDNSHQEEEQEPYTLVGPCYVEGLMNGEAFSGDGVKPKDSRKPIEIYLV
jgi:hypothetical protein